MNKDSLGGITGFIMLIGICIGLSVLGQWWSQRDTSPRTPTDVPRYDYPDYDETRHADERSRRATEDAYGDAAQREMWAEDMRDAFPLGNCNCSSGNQYNCDYFGEEIAAQLCYEKCINEAGYDIHWLDDDQDGRACEALP